MSATYISQAPELAPTPEEARIMSTTGMDLIQAKRHLACLGLVRRRRTYRGDDGITLMQPVQRWRVTVFTETGARITSEIDSYGREAAVDAVCRRLLDGTRVMQVMAIRLTPSGEEFGVEAANDTLTTTAMVDFVAEQAPFYPRRLAALPRSTAPREVPAAVGTAAQRRREFAALVALIGITVVVSAASRWI